MFCKRFHKELLCSILHLLRYNKVSIDFIYGTRHLERQKGFLLSGKIPVAIKLQK